MTRYIKTVLLLVALALAGCAAGPTHDQTLNEQGEAAMQAGNLPEAERLFTEAIQENPDNLRALNNLGSLYQNTGRAEQSRSFYHRVIDGEATAKEKGQDPEEAARLAQIARDAIDQMDREELARQEALMREAEARRAAEEAERAAQAAAAAVAAEPEAMEPGYQVQAGAFSRSSNAERMRERLMMRHSDVVDGKAVALVEAGRLTKVHIGPYSSADEAEHACRTLKRAGVSCFVIKP